MEPLIARSPESFGSGAVSRRQLIQSLALAAAAGPALTRPRPAPATSPAPGRLRPPGRFS